MSEAADALREGDHDDSDDLALVRQEAIFLATSPHALQVVPSELLALFYVQFAKTLHLRVASGERLAADEQTLLDAIKKNREQLGR